MMSYHDEPNRYGVQTPSDKSSSEKHEVLARRGVAVAEQAVYAMVAVAAVERQQKDLGPSYSASSGHRSDASARVDQALVPDEGVAYWEGSP